jgi:hypothetical protein
MIVSPAVRFAVNAPSRDVPVVVSVLAEAPFTVRFAVSKPAIVCELEALITLLLLSRRVAVPLTLDATATDDVVAES